MVRTLALRWSLFLVAVGLLAFASGFRVPLRAVAATNGSTFAFDGIERTYRVFRPAALKRDAPVPLVVMLHGGFGTGLQAERSYHWDAAATRFGFVVLYPDGIGRAWNAGDCCGAPQRRNLDDVGFLSALIERVARDENVDPRRVYVTGMSNGAMMAYRFACETPLAIAAIGPVAGTMSVACDRAKPTSVIAIHGLADGNVPFLGGVPTKGFEKSKTRRAVPSVLAQWREIDGCGAEASRTDGVVATSRALCTDGMVVELISVAGAGHQWPGGEPVPAFALAFMDQTSTALDATTTVWTFFAAHRSRDSAGLSSDLTGAPRSTGDLAP